MAVVNDGGSRLREQVVTKRLQSGDVRASMETDLKSMANIKLCGYLDKKGRNVMSGWQRRWFVLVGNGHYLKYYKDDADGRQILATIDLDGVQVVPRPASKHGTGVFRLALLDGDMHLRAKDAEEADEWMSTIEEIQLMRSEYGVQSGSIGNEETKAEPQSSPLVEQGTASGAVPHEETGSPRPSSSSSASFHTCRHTSVARQTELAHADTPGQGGIPTGPRKSKVAFAGLGADANAGFGQSETYSKQGRSDTVTSSASTSSASARGTRSSSNGVLLQRARAMSKPTPEPVDPPPPPAATEAELVDAACEALINSKLRDPAAATVNNALEDFVKSFHKKVRDASKSPHEADKPWNIIRSFLGVINELMKASGVWADEFSGADGPKPLARAVLAIEMLLFERIGPDLPSLAPEERAADAAIDSRLRCLAFVGVEHLDIKSLQNNTASPTPQSVEEQWAAPVSCLRAVSSAVGPSAKINKILDCAHEINRVLRQGNDGTLPSADDFLPAMILVVKLANPPQLMSTLSFIQQYCPAYLLMSEPGCYFTHVQR
mmetsp:Transcript_73609/g.209652  ORF Transcript_73609/g.209652 Transcript_73609/m.209652 type:complete len:549 (+) Transcript_73609:153-1799(+)